MYILHVYQIIYYSTDRGNEPVLEFLESLDKKSRAKRRWRTLTCLLNLALNLSGHTRIMSAGKFGS